VTGHAFTQRQGTGVSVTNEGEGPFHASVALIDVGTTPIPDDDLHADNVSLNGQLDADAGPITFYPALGPVPAMGTWGLAVLAAAMGLAGFWMIRRQEKMRAA
jgi:hypothetical protein